MLSLALALSVLVSGDCRPGDAPDVLFLLADDVGDESLAAASTPELDTLAAQGVRFDAFVCQTRCSPTRVQFLTGRQPLPAYGIGKIVDVASVVPNRAKNPPLPKTAFTLPELLKASGYATAAFGKWHVDNAHGGVDRESPRAHGFDTYRAGSIYGVGVGPNGYGGPDGSIWKRTDDGGPLVDETLYNTTAIVDEVVGWWTSTPGPRFAWVAFNASHAPFHAPPAALTPSNPSTSTTFGQHRAMTEAMDSEIGRLLASVNLGETLVVFAGDNGTPPAAVGPGVNPGQVKGSQYDGGISPPFFVAGWLVTPGDSPALVEAGDLFATLAELVGSPACVPRESLSFLEVLFDPGQRGPRQVAISAERAPNGFLGPFTKYERSARSSDRKLVLEGVTNPTKSLFAMPGDVLIPFDPIVAAELEAELVARGF